MPRQQCQTVAMTVLQNLALGRGNLDRLTDRRGDSAWLRQVITDPNAVIVGVSGSHIALDGAQLRNCQDLELDPRSLALIGEAGGRIYVAAMLEDPLPGSRSLREIGAELTDDEAAVATTAVALHQWHHNHSHCPRCGTPTVNALSGWERHCPVDTSAHYPRTDPCIIVGIIDNQDRLLLARQRVWAAHRYSVIAGYVEPGETVEHAVAREALEEVGLHVHSLEYVGSQPWPFPASLMLGFIARTEDSVIQVDGVEIEEARWVSRDELDTLVADGEILLPSNVSIARRIIEHWQQST